MKDTPHDQQPPDPDPIQPPPFAPPSNSPDQQDFAPGMAPPREDSSKFFVWLRSLGILRGNNRWVGGVCSGLGEKWGIDPVILRGLAVVLTLFFGFGLLAYGAAWALLPEPDGRIHVEQLFRGHWSTGMTGAALCIFLGTVGPGQSAWNGNSGWLPWPLFWIAGIVGLIVWASNRKKRSGAQASGQHPAFAPSAGSKAWEGQDWSSPPAGPYRSAGPSRDAWHEMKPAFKRVPRMGADASWLSVGLAVVAGALVLILDASGILSLNRYSLAAAAAVAAIVAGLAIMVSGFRARSAGGVGAFAVVALLIATALSVAPTTGSWSVLSKHSWTPTSVSAAHDGFSMVLTRATIDLTGISDPAALTQDVNIPLELAGSRVLINVPTDIPVTIKSDLAGASVHIQDQASNADSSVKQSSSTYLNPSATGYGLVVTLSGFAGKVTVATVGAKQ
ncbi:PspC domain-containing protein [Arthrobacter cryoconiti]|uniref:PspC domain-containing protein n=1 Tax=Arthrobacter cryoconiti TaxID=748907 RepID=A0ABV8QZ32_9MICC|nr:PspC domain-containing protein [Arthrobacter cryoconiti]MCC9069185.1 PspC domain-containing protein [Arthrobacter cryoconiti]